MDWIPGARHHDLSGRRGNGRFNDMHPFFGVVLHVNDVRDGTPPSWFVEGGGPDLVCPNFQVMNDGTIHQFLPLNWRPWCQRDGNDSFAAIETAGLASEPLTPAQRVSVATILAHYHRRLGLHLVVSGSPHERGLGTHRMGGAAWGGHVCPGPVRAHQRRELLAMAGTIVHRQTGTKPAKRPVPPARPPTSNAQLRHELGLTANQLHNARGIVDAVRRRGWAARAAVIATEVALAESGLRVLASANVPASVRYPHDLLSWTVDGLGHDHASCGMFQQQTGYRYAKPGTSTMGSPTGWGRPRELMDATISTEKFLDALDHVRWRRLARWQAAQAVQHSKYADGRNYRRQDRRARQIVAALWPDDVVVGADEPRGREPRGRHRRAAHRSAGSYWVRPGDTLSGIAARHHTTWPRLAKLNDLADPNLILIGQRLRLPARAR